MPITTNSHILHETLKLMTVAGIFAELSKKYKGPNVWQVHVTVTYFYNRQHVLQESVVGNTLVLHAHVHLLPYHVILW